MLDFITNINGWLVCDGRKQQALGKIASDIVIHHKRCAFRVPKDINVSSVFKDFSTRLRPSIFEKKFMVRLGVRIVIDECEAPIRGNHPGVV